MNKPELLAPANNIEVLKVAIRYGADAVYIGGEAFSLRSSAKNATIEELREGILYAHERNAKVYVASNIFAHEKDLSEATDYFRELSVIKPDGVILSDPGLLRIAKKEMPDIPLHLSTQANNCNSETFRFWKEQGFSRIVAARELSIAELTEIRKKVPSDLVIEAFVHGAMCISYSGRCLLSNFLTGRDANQGSCTHPCRWRYSVVEETRPGEYMPVYENERGTFIFHSKDLSMIDHLPELISAGVGSLKIEGRMKTALYVASVVRAYRKAIDDLFESESLYRENLPKYREEVCRCTHRAFTTGFYFTRPNEEAQVYEGETYHKGAVYMGLIESVTDGWSSMVQKNKFSVGDIITIMKPDGENIPSEVLEIRNEEGETMESCPHASEKLSVRFSVIPEPGDILRMDTEKEETENDYPEDV